MYKLFMKVMQEREKCILLYSTSLWCLIKKEQHNLIYNNYRKHFIINK